MIDPQLVRAIAGIEAVRLSTPGHRHMSPHRASEPLSMTGARQTGGRWNPRGIGALYLAENLATVRGELERLADRVQRPVNALLPRTVITYDVALSSVLDLCDPRTRELVTLTDEDLVADEPTRCRAVAAAARHAGMEAVRAPSAAGAGWAAAVFLDRLSPGSHVRPVSTDTWSIADATS